MNRKGPSLGADLSALWFTGALVALPMGTGVVGGAMSDTWNTTVAKPKRPEFSGVTEGVVLVVVDAGAAERIFHHDGMIDGHFHHLHRDYIVKERSTLDFMQYSHKSFAVLSARAESTQRRAKEGDFDFPLFGNSP